MIFWVAVPLVCQKHQQSPPESAANKEEWVWPRVRRWWQNRGAPRGVMALFLHSPRSCTLLMRKQVEDVASCPCILMVLGRNSNSRCLARQSTVIRLLALSQSIPTMALYTPQCNTFKSVVNSCPCVYQLHCGMMAEHFNSLPSATRTL